MENIDPELNFLVVDDSFEARNVITAFLRLKGWHNFEVAENGKQALKLLQRYDRQSKKFDVLIVDWNMPGMSGLDLFKEIREMENYSKTPFIMITADEDMDHVLEASHLGITGYIIKPITAENLFHKIWEILP